MSSENEMSGAKKDTHQESIKKDVQTNSPNPANLKTSKEDNTDLSEQVTTRKSKASLADTRRGPESVERRGSNGGNSNNNGHNVTTVYVHEDKQESSGATASSADHTPEEESPSSPDTMRRRGRRASEPAVGGFFIRRLQANFYNDTQFVQQRNNVESAELKRSIQKYLPSDIVAEEDEEDGDSKCFSRSTEDITKHFSESSKKLESSVSAGKGQNGNRDLASSKDVKTKDLSKDKTKAPKGNQAITKPVSGNPSRARRSSDGDVLSHISRKFHQERRGQGDNSPGNPRVLSAASRNKNLSVEASDENNDVWQAVRKCRYLRGYDPPEMTEPANMKEFVFGHESIDSLPPESK